MTEIIQTSEKLFDEIREVTKDGMEYWSARELMTTLDYKKWDKFQSVIEKAKLACINSKQLVERHFLQSGKMVQSGVASKFVDDF